MNKIVPFPNPEHQRTNGSIARGSIAARSAKLLLIWLLPPVSLVILLISLVDVLIHIKELSGEKETWNIEVVLGGERRGRIARSSIASMKLHLPKTTTRL